MAESFKPSKTVVVSKRKEMLGSWNNSILRLEAAVIKEALAAGVSPNMPVSDGDELEHALPAEYLVSRRAIAQQNKSSARKETERNASAIVDALIESGVKLAEPVKYQSAQGDVLMDRILHGD